MEGENKTSGSSAGFEYLLGNWKRSNEKEDRETFENWTKENNSEFRGVGFTLQNGDTIWQEKIILMLSNDVWEYKVTGRGEAQPKVFRLTRINEDGFTAENPENEFPQRIEYQKSGNKLIATISGDTMVIPFEFEKTGK